MGVLPGQQAFDMGLLKGSNPHFIQPASIDVRLNKYFIQFRQNLREIPLVDPAEGGPPNTLKVMDNDSPYHIYPKELVLACTLETIMLPNDIVATFEGKSSLGRLGIMTHVTAGFIDPGFSGQITVELVNVSNTIIKLWPGMAIGQICFMELTSPAKAYGSAGFGSSYQNQAGPVPYRVSSNFVKGIPNE